MSEMARGSGVLCGAGAELVQDNEIMKTIKNMNVIITLFENRNRNRVIFSMFRK